MERLGKIFPQFDATLLEALEEFGTIKTIPAGEVLMRTGQYVRNTMLVLDGTIKVYRESEEDGTEFLMYYLKSGEACALSIICAAKMEASRIMAQAMEDTTILMLPLHFLDEWMTKYKSWYYFVLETYRNRFDELLNLVDQVAFRNMDERLQFYLERYMQVNKTHIIPLSHQEIATDLNSSREVISRLLKKMEQRELLILHRNQIEMRNI